MIDCNGNGSKRKANNNPFFDFESSVKSVVKNLNKIKFNKYVYISTIYTYANISSKKNTIETKQNKNDKISPYGLTKRIAELYVKKYVSLPNSTSEVRKYISEINKNKQ